MMSEHFARLTSSEMDSIFNSIQEAIDAATASPSHEAERTGGRPPVEIVVGDCLDELRKLPSGSAQLVVTSPPYNIGKSYDDRLTIEEWTSNQAEVIAEAARVAWDNGSLCWQIGNFVGGGEVIPLDSIIIPLMRDIGLKMRNRIVWSFGHGLHCKHRLSGRHETIIWATKGDDYVFNLDPIRVPQKYPEKKHYKGPRKGQISGHPLGKNPGDVWDIPNVKHNHPEKTDHPCQFPEALIERLVAALTNESDLVIDPYAVSGTTGAVAQRLDRKALLIERDPGYAIIATKRLEVRTEHYSQLQR
jgi:adenine-specific DNA-methyltransferase